VKVIMGLGNPGRRYEDTRHNVGWWVLDHLADVWHCDGWRRNGDAAVTSHRAGAVHVRLLKPLTYVNLTGTALRPYLRRPSFCAATDLLVVVDDVALPVGRYRLRARGSSGGHNGLRSVEHTVGSGDYARVRIGIRPQDPVRDVGVLANFVLSRFGTSEREAILALMPRLTDAVEIWLRDGIERAMNVHNRGDTT